MNKNKGFTLIELLMVVFLGGFVVMGILQILNSNQKTSFLQKEIIDVQNTGFFVSNILSNDLRKAGSSDESVSKFDVSTFDFNNTIIKPDGNIKLTINYQNFDNDYDCGGISGLSNISNVYEVINENLYCNNIEIANNVKKFSMLFGADLDGDGFTDRYLDRNTAFEIQKSTNKKLISVKYLLILKSSRELEEVSTKTFRLIDGKNVTYKDGYFYRVFNNKVVLKNML